MAIRRTADGDSPSFDASAAEPGAAAPRRSARARDALRRPGLDRLLDLAVRIAGAGAVEALHVNYGLRDGRRRRRAPLRRAVRAPRRRRCTSTAREPPPAGNLQAWARDGALRGGRARPRRAGGATSPPVTPPPIRWRRSSTAWPPARAAGRCSAWRPREGRLIRPLLGLHPRADDGLLHRPRPELARGCHQRHPRVRARAHRGTSWCRRCARSIPAAEQTCSRWPRSCARRRRCSTSSSTRRSAGAGRSRWAGCARCRRRSRPLVAPAAGRRRRRSPGARDGAPREPRSSPSATDAALDLPHGVRGPGPRGGTLQIR